MFDSITNALKFIFGFRYWLFGEKISEKFDIRIKGWFPRSCVATLTDYESFDHGSKLKKDL